jgi:UDP-N-acetylmuramyl pentapeptide phosphotransferase/UDP-N-acetylglucosamine-1-phosphate transferase
MSIVVAATAFGLSAGLTYWFSRPGSRFYILDHPNERSLHSRPTPRTGGVAILAAVYLSALAAAVCCVAPAAALAWIAASGLLVAGVSFADDRFGLPVRYRLLAHFAGAGLVIAAGLGLTDPGLPGVGSTLPALLSVPVTLLFIVWMVNLYNFMDGMDGFAGGMAVFGFGTLALLGWMGGHETYALLNLVVAAAAGGFLLFNFPPARIFMGDAGSSSLGLFAAASSLWGASAGVFPFWAAVLVFSPFIVDATVTLIRRTLKGERLWQAHKSHYYQRLVQLGWGHRKTALWEYGLMAACSVSAVWAARRPAEIQWAMIAGWVLVYGLLVLLVNRLESRRAAIEFDRF